MALPLNLKPEDSAERPLRLLPVDPEVAIIELMDVLRPLADAALQLRDLYTRAGDPVAIHRRAHPRAIEIAEDAARALDAGEIVAQAVRAARAAYVDLGAR